MSRGKDFSLHIEAVELSDAGEYVSFVTLLKDIGVIYTIPEHNSSIILTIFSEFLNSL